MVVEEADEILPLWVALIGDFVVDQLEKKETVFLF